MPVNGDLTRLKYVPGFIAVAKRMIHNSQTVTSKMEGVQETRRQMRFDTRAMLVKYGVLSGQEK